MRSAFLSGKTMVTIVYPGKAYAMNAQEQTFLGYIAARLQESSSHAGAVIIALGMLHLTASPDMVNAGLAVAAAVGGLIMVFLRERAAVVKAAMFVPFALMLGLAACGDMPAVTNGQGPIPVGTVQADVAKAASNVNQVCGVVNTAAGVASVFSAYPPVAALEAFAAGSCGSAEAVTALVQKAVNDPATIAWAQDLATKLQTGAVEAKAALAKL